MTSHFTNIARRLRERSTNAEKLLWQQLRGRQLEGYKFRRQQPVGPHIVDFVNFEKRIVIELDGGQHAIEKENDKKRDGWLKALPRPLPPRGGEMSVKTTLERTGPEGERCG